MPNQSHTSSSEGGRKAPPQSDKASQQGKGNEEIQPSSPDRENQPETAQDKSSSTKSGKPS